MFSSNQSTTSRETSRHNIQTEKLKCKYEELVESEASKSQRYTVRKNILLFEKHHQTTIVFSGESIPAGTSVLQSKPDRKLQGNRSSMADLHCLG